MLVANSNKSIQKCAANRVQMPWPSQWLPIALIGLMCINSMWEFLVCCKETERELVDFSCIRKIVSVLLFGFFHTNFRLYECVFATLLMQYAFFCYCYSIVMCLPGIHWVVWLWCNTHLIPFPNRYIVYQNRNPNHTTNTQEVFVWNRHDRRWRRQQQRP